MKKKISIKKVKEIIEELKRCNSLEECSHNPRYYYNKNYEINTEEYIPSDLVEEFNNAYNSIKYKTKQEIETDDRAITEVERDENGYIQYYTFEIFRKNNPTLRGKLSRGDMETIYKLYSIYGANLTQKIVSREFPQYTFVEFKRILRAFNIYKSDSEFPLHMIEEKTEEELLNLHNKNKENNVLRKLEKNELSDTKKLLEKIYKENFELKQKTGKFEFEITNNVNPLYIVKQRNTGKSLSIYLSDLHVGACLESGSLYNNEWNEVELKRRMFELAQKISSFEHLDNLVINILGDSLDGMDRMTARRDHVMPQNMDNKKQVTTFLNIMLEFIGKCTGLTNNILIYCVPCGNHGGDYEWLAHQALQYAVNAKFPQIQFTLFDKFYGYYEFQNEKFLICHGKDSRFMKKPLPLNLDDHTSTMLRDYMDNNQIYGNNIHIVKGDLHSNNLNANRKFTYRNVLSLFGNSDYSMYNFPTNNYGVSYDLFMNGAMLSGTFEDF